MDDLAQADLGRLLALGLTAAQEAGDAINAVYGTAFAVEQKDDRSPLTEADRRSHRIILEHLAGRAHLRFPVLSEEGRSIPHTERESWPVLWIVDPLDGTKEFVKRNGEFTVNIALVSGGDAIVGIIHTPVRGCFHFGARGLGAYRLDGRLPGPAATIEEIIAASSRLPVGGQHQNPVVVGSRSHRSAETEEYVQRLRDRYGDLEFTSSGSAYKFCLVAEGAADIYPRFAPTMEWDTAAGQFLVEETGGCVIRKDSGEPLRYNKPDLRNPWFIAASCPFRRAVAESR